MALSLVGTVAAQIVSLYQFGLIGRLPDRPFWIFDSNKVNKSAYAYKRFAVPDAFLMLVSYGTTALLAATGNTKRPKIARVLMTGKIALDVLSALKLGQEEWAENKKLCLYCQSATLASIISLFLAWREMKS